MISKYKHFEKLNNIRKFVTSSGRCLDEYRQVPHYKQKSALYISPPLHQQPTKSETAAANSAPVFPNIISPDLDLTLLFDTKNALKPAICHNLTARHTHINTLKLKDDYTRMRQLKIEIDGLTREKDSISASVNNLTKAKMSKQERQILMQSDTFTKLLHKGNEVKHEIIKLRDELIPLEEIVNIACLRLPNDLHFSTYYLYKTQLDNEKFILFDFNQEHLEQVKRDSEFLISSRLWQHAIDSKFSFVQQSSINSSINMKYLVGTYAKIEKAIQDFIYEKLSSLNAFEHIKSVSMFKSALVEGCGQNFNDTRQIFNIVRFGSHHTDATNIELLHLTGNSSLNSLILNFVRSQTKENYLPWTLFTNGKSYSPKNGQISSFDLLTLCSDKSLLVIDDQKYEETNFDAFLYKGKEYLNEIKSRLDDFVNQPKEKMISTIMHDSQDKSRKIDAILIDKLKLMIYAFKDFNFPMRFCCLNPSELNWSESLRIQLQCYLPSEHRFITIGEVSMLNEYNSKRLQIRIQQKSTSSPLKHVSMIYTRLIDVNLFTQILIESNLVKNQQDVSLTKIKFNLPEPLKNFY